jgi:uncharacterized membrane protein HdeD (DUF308 family)
MWVRAIIGVILCVTGIVWIAQGLNLIRGSGMSGHGVYAILGAVALIIGAFLLSRAWRLRTH